MARGRSTRAVVVTHRATPLRSRPFAPSTRACFLSSCSKGAQVNVTTTTAQIRLSRLSPAYWRITFDNPPLNVMGPQFVQEFREVVTAIEDDEQVKVVVFDSAVEGYFLNHSDFLANFDDLKRIPAGPTGLEAWPDGLVRLTVGAGLRLVHLGGDQLVHAAASDRRSWASHGWRDRRLEVQ